MVVDYNHLLQHCAQGVNPVVMHGIISQESSFNPFAIGVVNGRLKRQPRTYQEGIAAIQALQAKGMNFSVGLAQINKQHFKRFGLNYTNMFNMCENVKAGAAIYKGCLAAANKSFGVGNFSTWAALSCYYSGNFSTGFKRYGNDKMPYVSAVSRKMMTYNSRPSKIGSSIPVAFNNQVTNIATFNPFQSQKNNNAPIMLATIETNNNVPKQKPFVIGSRNVNLARNNDATEEKELTKRSSLVF